MPPRDHHLVVVAFADSPYLRQERLGRLFEGPVVPGDVILVPAGYETIFSGILAHHIQIALSRNLLMEGAEEFRKLGTRTDGDISNHFLLRDETLQHFGAALSAELARDPHPIQDLIVESISNGLTLHLLRKYGHATEILERRTADGSTSAIRRALDYIEDSPNPRISLAELTAVAGLSRFHFSRLFKRQMGLSPTEYLEKTRIQRATRLLDNGDMSLADVAQEVGFADQSHFTRRFKHHVGCTPAVYAREYTLVRHRRSKT